MSSKVTNISTSALKKLVILLAFNSLAAARSSSRPSAFVARPPLPNSEIKTRSRSICCMVSSGAPQPHRVGGALSIFGGRGLLLKDQEQQHSSTTIAPASCEDELEQQEHTTTYDYYYNDGIQIATVTEKNNFFGNKIDDFIEDTFDKADTNGNGRISASETYDLVLQIYLKINRQAPINPPSREKAALIFDNADKDQNGDIDRAEFKRLMAILLSRASTRLVAHKFLTLVGAPFLAWELTGFLSDKVGLLNWVATKLIAEQQYLETVTNEGFWQTVFTVLFVTTLGDTILTKTSSIYDKLLIEEKE